MGIISLSKQQIDTAMLKIKVGLEKYLWIQNEVNKRDVSLNKDFQKKFNAFYKITPFRDNEWQKVFYEIMQSSKGKEVSFNAVLTNLHSKVGRIEASFASKLVATLSPQKPVIDKIVFGNLGLKLPAASKKGRNLIIIEQYNCLIKEFSNFLQTQNGVYLVQRFKEAYPEAKITETKMLDLILWQTRTNKSKKV